VGPNPFAAIANIEFSLSSPARVEVSVFSVDGSRVRRVESADYPAGESRILWDGTDDGGRRLPSGVYLVRVSANFASAATRVTILR
jgi:flagellar hook assembly protein FlgD